MNQPIALNLEAPRLSGTKLGQASRLDRPLTLRLEPIKLPDGSVLGGDGQAGAFLFRLDAQGARIWNEQAARWQVPPADTELGVSLAPISLLPTGSGAYEAALNPGRLDAAGRPQFSAALDDAPKYFARVLVTGSRAGQAYRGLSGPSPMLALTRVASLVLPVPLISQPGVAGPSFEIEKPLVIALPPPALPGGLAVTAETVVKFGVFVYRNGEIWNETAQAWQSAPADPQSLAEWTPLLLAYQAGQPLPWQGTLVAMGQVDKNQAPRFAPLNEGGASYRLRAFALIKDADVSYLGLGPESAGIVFVKTMGQENFKFEFDTDGPKDCREVVIRLSDGANRVGYLKISAANRQVEVASCDAGGVPRAKLVLNSSGDIEIQPSGKLIVQGDLEAGRIRYQPAAGGAKRDL